MDQKETQTGEHPVSGTDQAPNPASTEAPTAAPDQGESVASAETSSLDETFSASTPEDADATLATAADATPEEVTETESEYVAAPAAESTPADEDLYAGSVPSSTDDDDGANMTMEEVMAASDEQLARKPINRGTLTTGTVIMLSQDGLVVDVGQKVEGLVPYNQLFEFETTAEDAAQYFKPGD